MTDEEPKRRTVAHEVGCDLSELSVDELSARLILLKQEISRLEAERDRKVGTMSAAEALFKGQS